MAGKRKRGTRIAGTSLWSDPRGRVLENPDAKTTALIIQMHDEGRSRSDIAKTTGLKPDTIRKLLAKEGRGSKKGKALSREKQEEILALHAGGMSEREISRSLDVHRRTVARVIERAGPLKAKIEERITARVKEEAGPIESLPVADLRAAQVRAAKDSAEFTWAIAATKMLLVPAMQIPRDQRLKRLEQEMRKGITELTKTRRTYIVDGHNLVRELRDIAVFAVQMIEGAEPEAYLKRYRKGGVKAMMEYAEKVVAEAETPIEAEQISDFVTLATMRSTRIPTGTGRALSTPKLAEELAFGAGAWRQGETGRSLAAMTKELSLIEKLRGLMNRDPERFLATIKELRREVAAGPAFTSGAEAEEEGYRAWGEQRLRNVIWELLRTEEARSAMQAELLADMLAQDPQAYWAELRRLTKQAQRRRGRGAKVAAGRLRNAIRDSLDTDQEREEVLGALAGGVKEMPAVLRRKKKRQRRGVPPEILAAIKGRQQGDARDAELARYRRTREQARRLAVAQGMEPTDELIEETLKLLGVSDPKRPKRKTPLPTAKRRRRELPLTAFPVVRPPTPTAVEPPGAPPLGYATRRPRKAKPAPLAEMEFAAVYPGKPEIGPRFTERERHHFPELVAGQRAALLALRTAAPSGPKIPDVLSERARAKRERRDFRIVEAVLGGYSVPEAAKLEGVSERVAQSAVNQFDWTLLDALDATGAEKVTKKVADVVADAIGVPISAAQIKAIQKRWKDQPRWMATARPEPKERPVVGFGGIELAGEAEREAIARASGWLKNPASSWGTRLFARVNAALATGEGFLKKKKTKGRSRQERRAAERRRLGKLMRL